MLQKMDLQQLQAYSLEDVNAFKERATARKGELEAAKAIGGEAWTSEMQDELNEIAIFLVDVEDCIDEKTAGEAEKEMPSKLESYIPKPGTEDMVHLKLIKGKRYNPNTGEEISKPHPQIFTFSEWQLFKKNFAGLGYVIVEVLHDSHNDAKQYITAKK